MHAALGRLQRDLDDRSLTIEKVAYLTGRRRAYVFRVDTRSPSGSESFFLKFGVSADEEILEYVRGEATKTSDVHRAMSGSARFLTAEPAAYYEDLGCFVLRGARGTRLDALIMKSARLPADRAAFGAARQYCSLAAGWLSCFQERMSSTVSVHTTTIEALLARAEREVVVLNLSAPGEVSDARCRTLRNRFSDLLSHFEPDDFLVTARHNDFAPWNVLCAADSVCVIDFADLSEGCRYFDAYQFLDAMDVLSHKPLTRSASIAKLRDTFIHESSLVAAASGAASAYFDLLCRLIRTNAVLNNARTGFPFSLRNRRLLRRYLVELWDDAL